MAAQEEPVVSAKGPESKFCIFEYRYRDASNYKAWGEVLLSGMPRDNEIAALRDCLVSGEYFVAEQVGIPPLYEELWELSGGPTEDDHALHELVAVREASDDETKSMELLGAWTNILKQFQGVTARDYTLSPNCSL